MIIKVLGTGCANCKTLENHTRKAVEELGTHAEVVKVDDITEIIEYNVIRTPALVIDEKVVMYGKVPTVNEIKELIDSAGKNN
jgi:small redox-active disulfide protein 2